MNLSLNSLQICERWLNIDFGSSLKDMLRDQLVCGVNDATIQPKLTYAKAVELTRGLETADKNLKLLSKGKGKQGTESTQGSSMSSSQAVLNIQIISKERARILLPLLVSDVDSQGTL